MEIELGPDGEVIFSRFEGLEAYRIAIEIENRGAKFYADLLDQAVDPALAEAFRFLLREEERHGALFHKELGLETAVGAEGGDVLVRLVEAGIFSRPPEPSDLDDFEKVKQFSLRVEAESIRFYQALLANTTDPGGKRVIGEIIEEERSHIEKLKGLS